MPCLPCSPPSRPPPTIAGRQHAAPPNQSNKFAHPRPAPQGGFTRRRANCHPTLVNCSARLARARRGTAGLSRRVRYGET